LVFEREAGDGRDVTRVLIADDDPLTASGIELLLANTNFQVVANVRSGKEVLDTMAASRPELLVLDIRMPERTGLDVLRTLRGRGDKRPVVLLTGSINDQAVREAMELGVEGLVIKANAPGDLPACLEAVSRGRRWFDQEVMQRAMELAQDPGAGRDPLEQLSVRERGIVALVQRGLRNKEVAEELGLTEGTVKVHLHKIFEKLGIQSRTELILLGAQRDGGRESVADGDGDTA
jgi:two-component system nitrate/nitrite response regulator NarP